MAFISKEQHPWQQSSIATHPRISFSNGFAEAASHKHCTVHREANQAAEDFEFSAPAANGSCAEELFSGGKLVPLKGRKKQMMTLRDELMAVDDDDDDDPRVGKGPIWWREKFGFKKNNGGRSQGKPTPTVGF